MLLNYWIVYCGGTTVVNPQPSKVSRLLLSQLSLSAQHNDSAVHKYHLFCSQHKFIIQASVSQSNSVTRAYSKTASFAKSLHSVAPAIDLKAVYDAKNGAPTAAAPKVFFKWFYAK